MTPAQQIREAAHEVQRPVFFARGMIITAYLPIFTLQAVEGRLFKPMAWMVSFALLGALVFSLLLAPVLSSLLFPKGATEWQNPVMTWLTKQLPPRRQVGHRASPRHLVDRRGRRLLLAGYPRLQRRRSAPSSCLTSTKAPSGCAARSHPPPARPRACA